MIDFILRYWIQFLFGAVITTTSILFRQIIIYKKRIDSLVLSTQLILKVKIIEIYEKIMDRNCVTFYEKELIVDLYDKYKELDGNGFIENIIEKIDDLPVRNDCEDD